MYTHMHTHTHASALRGHTQTHFSLSDTLPGTHQPVIGHRLDPPKYHRHCARGLGDGLGRARQTDLFVLVQFAFQWGKEKVKYQARAMPASDHGWVENEPRVTRQAGTGGCFSWGAWEGCSEEGLFELRPQGQAGQQQLVKYKEQQK